LHKCFYYDIFIYAYNVLWFGSSPSLFSFFPSLFLKWLRHVPMLHIHTCVENASTLPTCTVSIFTWPVVHFCPLLVKCLWLFSGVLPWYFTCKLLYFNQCNTFYYSSLSFPCTTYCSIVFIVSYSCTDQMYFNIALCHSVLLSLLP
jgi:hypothetical protein